MQFEYNSDYPGLSAIGPTDAPSSEPMVFPPAQPIPCARITTRVFHPDRNQVATVPNVLIRTAPISTGTSNVNGDENDSLSSAMSSSSDDDSMMRLEDDMGALAVDTSGGGVVQHAYWIQRTIREAIYGRVLFAVVLRRRPGATDGADWEVTSDHCAVKEMSWEHIRREGNRLAEDPIKEVSAMQFIQKWFESTRRRGPEVPSPLVQDNGVAESFEAMRSTNIMMPLDLLTDERNLYSIMPYCDGGELFERLDLNERFSEEEARYWMDQVLNVSLFSHAKGAFVRMMDSPCYYLNHRELKTYSILGSVTEI